MVKTVFFLSESIEWKLISEIFCCDHCHLNEVTHSNSVR